MTSYDVLSRPAAVFLTEWRAVRSTGRRLREVERMIRFTALERRANQVRLGSLRGDLVHAILQRSA